MSLFEEAIVVGIVLDEDDQVKIEVLDCRYSHFKDVWQVNLYELASIPQ